MYDYLPVLVTTFSTLQMQDDQQLYLVMEFHPGGDLLSLLDRYDGTFSEDMARFYLAEITLAIHDLHSMGYVHRYVSVKTFIVL